MPHLTLLLCIVKELSVEHIDFSWGSDQCFAIQLSSHKCHLQANICFNKVLGGELLEAIEAASCTVCTQAINFIQCTIQHIFKHMTHL